MSRVALIAFAAPSPARGGLPDFPSPALLARAATLAAAGAEVHTVTSDELATSRWDRVLVAAPPWSAIDVAALRDKAAGAPVEAVDPWGDSSAALPAYELARHVCHGEADLAPAGAPVHPWVWPSGGPLPSLGAAARIRAAGLALVGLRDTALVIGDERVALDHDRLAMVAAEVTRALVEHKSLVALHLRLWPHDLTDERVLAQLSLLPVTSLELLVGSLHPPSLSRMQSRLTEPELRAVVAAVARAGLGHLTSLSIAVALPGERIADSVAVLDATLRLAAEHRLRGVRAALWLGTSRAPRHPREQKELFLDTHREWSEAEYRGFHDLVAVIRTVAAGIELVGPGFLPEWDEVP